MISGREMLCTLFCALSFPDDDSSGREMLCTLFCALFFPDDYSSWREMLSLFCALFLLDDCNSGLEVFFLPSRVVSSQPRGFWRCGLCADSDDGIFGKKRKTLAQNEGNDYTPVKKAKISSESVPKTSSKEKLAHCKVEIVVHAIRALDLQTSEKILAVRLITVDTVESKLMKLREKHQVDAPMVIFLCVHSLSNDHFRLAWPR